MKKILQENIFFFFFFTKIEQKEYIQYNLKTPEYQHKIFKPTLINRPIGLRIVGTERELLDHLTPTLINRPTVQRIVGTKCGSWDRLNLT